MPCFQSASPDGRIRTAPNGSSSLSAACMTSMSITAGFLKAATVRQPDTVILNFGDTGLNMLMENIRMAVVLAQKLGQVWVATADQSGLPHLAIA